MAAFVDADFYRLRGRACADFVRRQDHLQTSVSYCVACMRFIQAQCSLSSPQRMPATIGNQNHRISVALMVALKSVAVGGFQWTLLERKTGL